MLSRPVRGEARIDQATAATSGGTNSGSMLAAAMKPLQGVLVRTTTQEKVRPMTTASAVPPPQAISELASARWTLGLARTVTKFAERDVEDAEAIHHRIGVGERAQQQHGDGVDDEEGEDEQQRGRTRASQAVAGPAGACRGLSPRQIGRDSERWQPSFLPMGRILVPARRAAALRSL